METKEFKGKAIYTSGGPASEYGKYGAGFYVGCSNGCTYCYLKTKHPFKYACGGDIPTLKKHFKNEARALEVFEKELVQNLHELQKHGLFFSFTTDPMLPETWLQTIRAINFCGIKNVPVKILTKRADWADEYLEAQSIFPKKMIQERSKVAFGFTLTGRDDLEPNASTNAERIEAMRKLHEAGFKTWASVEPVIDVETSMKMIAQTRGFCNLYKVGIERGKKYSKNELQAMINYTTNRFVYCKFYFKDSLLKQAGINRSDLPSNCVDRDYSLFND